jgi:hypothetical protein
MVPSLATIIWAYVAFRMLEVFALNPTHYRSRGNHVAAMVLAAIVVVVTTISLVSVYEAGSRISALPELP